MVPLPGPRLYERRWSLVFLALQAPFDPRVGIVAENASMLCRRTYERLEIPSRTATITMLSSTGCFDPG
jgi:hypothetical protein